MCKFCTCTFGYGSALHRAFAAVCQIVRLLRMVSGYDYDCKGTTFFLFFQTIARKLAFFLISKNMCFFVSFYLFYWLLPIYKETNCETSGNKKKQKETKRNKKKQNRLYLFRYNSLNSNKITPFAPKRNKIFASRQFLLRFYSFPIHIGGHKKNGKSAVF